MTLFNSSVATYGILVLLIVVSLEAFPKAGKQSKQPAGGNHTQTKAPETETATAEASTTEEETTQKIVKPEPEPIDEFYNYEEPLDEYNNYKPNILYDWKHVKEAYDVKDIKFLRYLCTKVHELAGWGRVNVSDFFILDHGVIVYKNPEYFPTDTEFLQYITRSPVNFGNRTMDHFFITEGLKEDCIFYITPTGRQLNAFSLDQHVCGVHRALKGSKNETHPAAAGISK